MNAEEIINLNKKALYSSVCGSDVFDKFFNKSILNNAVIMEIFSNRNNNGISYENLCSIIPKSLGSRSSIQNLLNEGLDKNILEKVENKQDKRIKNYFLSETINLKVLDWIKKQKTIFNS